MNPILSKINTHLNLLSIIGPISVIATLFVLVIKNSPLQIDLFATALAGLVLTWHFRWIGFALGSLLLSSVLATNFLLETTLFTIWEAGLAFSMEVSFLMTALSSTEMKSAFEAGCVGAARHALKEMEEWKEKIGTLVQGKESLESEIEANKTQMLGLQASLKSEVEQSEMFARLLEKARRELIELTHALETSQRKACEEKNRALAYEASIEEERRAFGIISEEVARWEQLHQKLEMELRVQSEAAEAQERQLHKQALERLDLEWKVEKLEEEMRSMAGDYEGKVQALGEQLESLIDRLKHLQTEKEDLEKELEDVLKPSEGAADESREFRSISGKYHQLREQFYQKSDVLDNTRKELFHTQEALYRLEREIDEERLADPLEIIASYERYIVLLSDRIERLEAEVQCFEHIHPIN